MSLYDWSITAADNDDADSNINWTEGQNPNSVNNSARAQMAAVAAFLAQINGATSSTGSADAYAFASATGNTITAYAAGNMICFKANFTNAGSATLNVDTLGAKTLKKYGSTNLVANDIESGNIVVCRYDGTNFLITSQITNANIEAFAALTGAADKIAYWTGVSAMATTTLTSAGRSLIDDATVAAMRTTLGLVIGTNVQAQDADLQAIADLTSTADRLPYSTGSATWSLTTITLKARELINQATEAGMRGELGLPENTKNITFGTAAPGALGDGEIYIRHD